MLKLLVVEDTRSVHAFLKALLKKLPEIQSTHVNNGAEAVELLKKGATFDFILLDWEMPVLNGPMAFEEFKKLKVTAPVVMMTTKNEAVNIEEMLNAGVAEYLLKPFTLDILVEKLEGVSGKNIQNVA